MGKIKVKFDIHKQHLGGNVVGGDPFSFSPYLWKWAIDTFNAKSVLDVGCGDGLALDYFRGQNLRVVGIDGLQENVDEVQKRGLECVLLDLTLASYKADKPFDIIWCCELVEHIDEKYVDNIFDTFLSGRIILMTHAMLRQRGYHHVNCQNDKYWIDVMGNKGFEYLKKETLYSRTLEVGQHWGKSGLIFKNLKVLHD
jgi:2-polyprenyl-3-methyl-5-hydroxy-6-metoxy-1,4-benzoquinol methylase